MLGLLRLPEEVQEMINNNHITMGHARVLSKLEDSQQIIDIANNIYNEKLTVRDLENKVDNKNFERKNKIERKPKVDNSEYKYVEELLCEKLDTKIKIRDNKVIISFSNINDLNRILEIINIKE